jgi:hypothetical protein
MARRTFGSGIRVNALAKAMPSDVENTVQGRGLPIGLGCVGQALEEEGYRHAKDLAQLLQAARADTVRTLLVFLNLLKCQPKRVCDFFLALVEHKAPHTQAPANMRIGRMDPVHDHRQVL